jgi:hypothetical protein
MLLIQLKCLKCPNRTASFPYSIGKNSCFEKKKCIKDDYLPILGSCVDGKTQIKYELKSKLCDDNNTQIPEKIIKCFECREGEKLIDTVKKKCEKCENGK